MEELLLLLRKSLKFLRKRQLAKFTCKSVRCNLNTSSTIAEAGLTVILQRLLFYQLHDFGCSHCPAWFWLYTWIDHWTSSNPLPVLASKSIKCPGRSLLPRVDMWLCGNDGVAICRIRRGEGPLGGRLTIPAQKIQWNSSMISMIITLLIA